MGGTRELELVPTRWIEELVSLPWSADLDFRLSLDDRNGNLEV